MQSIHTVITKRFLKQALYPVLIIELSLVITLFALNNYQSNENKEALHHITTESFQEIAIQASDTIQKRFEYDESHLKQIQATTDLLFKNAERLTPNPNEWIWDNGFFKLDVNYKKRDQNLSVTPVYTTNLTELDDEEYAFLNTLKLLVPTIKSTVDTENDLITSAWINIDKRFALAYPPINPASELSSDLDVTQYPFYYLADPINNSSRSAVFIPLYKEPWAIDTGELGAYLMPIYVDEQFLGVIGLTLTGKAFEDVFAMMQLPFNAYAVLLDNENHLIVSSNNEASFSDFGHRSFYDLYRHKEYQERTLMKVDPTSLDTSAKIVYEQQISDKQLRLMIIAEKSEVFATVETVSSHTKMIGIGFVIAIGFFYFIFYRLSQRSTKRLAAKITHPLDLIVQFSSKLGRDENIQLETSDIDELQSLNHNLNQTHQKLLDMIIKDEESGLYNRHKLLDDLQKGDIKSLMLIQVGNYKTLHNLYGQGIINAIIKGVVDELKCHPSLQAYRIGDDDFAITNGNDDYKPFSLLFNAISSQVIHFESVQVHPFLFAGMASKSDDAEGNLIEQAGIALLYAQRNIASKPVCYTEAQTMKAEFDDNLEWSNRLNDALKNDLLIPYFQPIYNLQTKKIEKFESLVRMQDGDNIISPFYFLPTASAIGKSHEITKIMIDKVMKVAAQYPQFGFNINISFKDFEEFDLTTYVKLRCNTYNIAPQQITFELLETDALTNPDLILDRITALKQAGFKIAIDDFGTGHSNFAHLMNMRVDYIKIDGQFVKNILKDPNSASITKTIAQFASLVGAQTVAEYVADDSIVRRIRRFNIDYAQGYAISPPLPEDQIKTILHKEFNFF